MKHHFATKVALTVALVVGTVVPQPSPVFAGIPVIDAGNLTQNILSALQAVTQTAKQIQQYRTQLQQYENMLRNTLAPTAYIWDQAQTTVSSLLQAQNTLKHYKRQLGSLDKYLAKYKDVNFYRASPCFTGTGCPPEQQEEIEEARRLANEAQKKANDALFRSLDKQQDAMTADARTLQQLQSRAQSADGQLQAIGYANQLASQQSNQLLQIRGLLLAQQNVVATNSAIEQDQAARDMAKEDEMTKGSYQMPTAKKW